MIKAHDLSNTQGTYTNALQENLNTIFSAYNDSSISTEELRQVVIDSVSSAKDTEAKRKFLMNLNKQRNKDNIVMFVNNTYLRGCGMGANLDDKFAR